MITAELQPGVKPKQERTEAGPYWEEFKRLEKGAKELAWVRAARKAGISHFVELGFPTLQDEDWRFTNVAPITNLPFKPVFERAQEGLTAKALGQFTLAGLPGIKLVFVNGHFAPELSPTATLPEGVRVISLAAALASDPALVEKHLFRHARADASAFTALNTAFFQDGAFIRIGFDTPKLASAWIGGKMTDGELLYPQESQCISADVSLGLCREIPPGGDE